MEQAKEQKSNGLARQTGRCDEFCVENCNEIWCEFLPACNLPYHVSLAVQCAALKTYLFEKNEHSSL